MGRLRLIIGPPGSGKTRLLLSEIAGELAREALGPSAAPPLVLLVPEQQAAQMERALLEAIAEFGAADCQPAYDPQRNSAPLLQNNGEDGQSISGQAVRCPVNSCCQVFSFRWLARRLELAAGEMRGTLSDTGRRLLVWKLLGEIDPQGFTDAGVRNETAALLARLLGELAQCGAKAQQLQARAEALAAGYPQLARKAGLLAEVMQRFCAHCELEGLHFTAPPARIPQLLTERNWPMLTGTRVWVDGFSSFTPAEELALAALLTQCESVTAALLLDPARSEGPLDSDLYDWYAPTRDQYARWQELAAKAGAQFDPATDVVRIDTCTRWPQASPLRVLAQQGLQAARGSAGATATQQPAVVATVHASERAEVTAAAREIRRLVLPRELGGAGLRYGQISVALRSLPPYAGLIELAFAELGIPCFIDRRRPLAHHPACTLLRGGLRLALGCAQDSDAAALLKCGLLGLGGEPTRAELQRRADLLENYARAAALRPGEWASAAPWQRWPESDVDGEQVPAELAELDSWRTELLGPVIALRMQLAAASGLSVRAVLEQAWLLLITDSVRAELRAWAQAAESTGQADEAELHQRVLQELAHLLDEVVALCGHHQLLDHERTSAYPNSISNTELCRMLDSGIRQLSIGFPPPRLDSVLVTDIARGRHHQVAATLLLGMADDCWPPPLRPGAYFSDAERALLNTEGALLPPGAGALSRAEPYLALVACTRPTEYLWLSRPAADSEGRGRTPSPFYSGVLDALGIEERATSEEQPAADSIATAADLVIAAALYPQDAGLQSAALALCAHSPLMRGLEWARARIHPVPLEPALMQGLLHMRAGPPEVTIRQLEELGACPFRHFARRLLRLQRAARPPREAVLARFYRRLLLRTLTILRDGSYDWTARAAQPIRDAASQALGELGGQLASQGDGSLHQLERAGLLLQRVCDEIAALPAGRAPKLLGVGYGSGQKFDPLTVDTKLGQLRVRGIIERIDLDGAGATIVDLRLRTGADALHWPRFLAGVDLRLPAALLALRGHKLWDLASGAQTELRAGNAEAQRVEPHWEGDAASFAGAPLRPTFSRDSDNAKVGALIEHALDETQRILGELGERLLSGEIAPLPLRHGRWTACSECELRPLCRFDPAAGEQYRSAPGSPATIRNAIAAGESFSGSAGAKSQEAAQ